MHWLNPFGADESGALSIEEAKKYYATLRKA